VSPASAIAWEFRARHRWGLLALAAYSLILAAVKLVIVMRGITVTFVDAESFAFADVVPLTATFIYFLSVFTFGLGGDIAARQSMYPARLFTLPLTTGALVFWPMLYGAIAMTALWILSRLAVVWPADVRVPLAWPAFLAASLLAWTQALTWMPYALRGMRVIVTVLWLMIIDTIVMVALNLQAPEPVMIALVAPQIPLAYLVARFAVARARRGDTPDWHAATAGRARTAAPFRSNTQAQLWFEWRQGGRALPLLVALLLPFELAMLVLFRGTPAIAGEMLLLIAFTPPIMAAFVAATMSRPGAFAVMRPMPDTALIAAKLRVAIYSTAATWLLLLATTLIVLRLSGTGTLVADQARQLREIFGTARAVSLVLLALAFVVASTWKLLVQSLFIGMSGRAWLAKASVFGTLTLLAIFPPLAHWALHNHEVMKFVWNGMPWFLGFLVCLKTGAGAWIAHRLHAWHLMSERALLAGALAWNAAVFALFALLAWTVPELLVRHYVLALVAILVTPLARVSAAPLALAWNRHR